MDADLGQRRPNMPTRNVSSDVPLVFRCCCSLILRPPVLVIHYLMHMIFPRARYIRSIGVRERRRMAWLRTRRIWV